MKNPTPSIRPSLSISIGAALIGLLALGGCGRLGLDDAETSDGSVSSQDEADDRVAVIIEGRPVSVAEVDAYLQESFMEDLKRQPPAQIYEAREKGIREMVQKSIIDAEAEKRGLTADELFDEIVAQAPAPSVEDVTTWYAENQNRLRGARLEDVSGQIEQMLANESRAQAWRAFIGPKLEALDFELVLQPPRQDLEATRLVRGEPDAPVTIMTFSDYQCPYCIRAEPVLAEVLERYPGKVRVVHRHFPLDSIHPFARPAAEAAMCADEQGEFWAFHDAIFARGGKLEAGSFLEMGSEIGLDPEALETCIEERRYAEFVQKDFEAGESAGVTGTPAFFVNGIALKGARDADELSEVVESELARTKLN